MWVNTPAQRPEEEHLSWKPLHSFPPISWRPTRRTTALIFTDWKPTSGVRAVNREKQRAALNMLGYWKPDPPVSENLSRPQRADKNKILFGSRQEVRHTATDAEGGNSSIIIPIKSRLIEGACGPHVTVTPEPWICCYMRSIWLPFVHRNLLNSTEAWRSGPTQRCWTGWR